MQSKKVKVYSKHSYEKKSRAENFALKSNILQNLTGLFKFQKQDLLNKILFKKCLHTNIACAKQNIEITSIFEKTITEILVAYVC